MRGERGHVLRQVPLPPLFARGLKVGPGAEVPVYVYVYVCMEKSCVRV